MNNLRVYGKAPFDLAVLHGGPGAPGQMAPVARELCGDRGMLEPIQTATSRLSRLSEDERREALSLNESLDEPTVGDKNTLLARLGKLFTKADTYAPLTLDTEELEIQYSVHQSVWRDAAKLRASGDLLELGKKIRCPVVAIHGDYDPHPPEGVQEPLSAVLKDFRFILLKNCGHLPWIETEARDKFYDTLREELA